MIKTLFKTRFDIAKERGWDHLIIAVDLHDTVINSTIYNQFRKTLPDGEAADTALYEEAILPLKHMTNRKDIKLMWYTGTDDETLAGISAMLKKNYGIEFDGRVGDEEYDTVHKGQDFTKKPCFDILLDDKAGFDPSEDDSDWEEVTVALQLNIL